ncbi:MAG: flippase [Gammaproteobacteria bacterium]|nr:flippase [Gammaproteobacteria bacterium]
MDIIKFIKKSSLVLVARSTGAALAFIIIVVFARLLDVSEFGIYSFSISLITILSVITRFGFDNVLLKRVSYYKNINPRKAKGYITTALKIVIYLGLLFSLALLLFSEFLYSIIIDDIKFSDTLKLLGVCTIPLAINVVFGEVLKAYDKPILATLFQTVLTPCITLAFIYVYSLYSDVNLYVVNMSVTIGYFSIAVILLVYINHLTKKIIKKDIEYMRLVKEGWPMLLISSGALILSWSDVLVLGIFSDPEAVGIYSAASRTVLVTSLILIAINSITAPKYAVLYKIKDNVEITKLAQFTSSILFFIVVFPTFILLYFPDYIMGLFGDEYIEGSNALVILTIGQFFNVVCGSVGYLLMMTGKEKIFRDILLKVSVINIVLSILLVRDFGYLGVSVATSVSVIMWNVWAMYEVKKHLGFWTIKIFNF